MVHDDDDDDDDDAISIQWYFLFTPLQYLYKIYRHIKPVLFILSDCPNYNSLTDSGRKVTPNVTVSTSCDNSLTSGWYRFEGSAGTRMPTSCVPIDRCDASATGWLSGGHPTVAEGQVSRTVCFHWTSGCCEFSTSIQVRNCSAFYIYYFSGTPTCNLRFCGTD